MLRSGSWIALLGLVVSCGDDSVGNDGGESSHTTGESDGATSSPSTSMLSTSVGGTNDASTAGAASTSSMEGEGDTTQGAEGGTTTTTSGSTTTVADSDSTSDTQGGTSDIQGGVEGCYDPMLYPYAGTLCGPPSAPCMLVADETVDPTPHFRNGAPAITLNNDCQPQILYSIAEGGFSGHFAVRTGPGTWDDQPTPFAVARGGLSYDAVTSRTLAIASDGAFGVTVWGYDGTWGQLDTLMGDQYLLRSAGVASLGTSELHLAVRTDDGEILHGLWDESPVFTDVGTQGVHEAIAMSSDGVAHLTFWSAVNATWDLLWGTPGGGPAEVVLSLGSNALNVLEQRVAVTPNGGGATPHVVVATQVEGTELHQVVYATRTGPNAWDVTLVAAEDPAVNETCSDEPTDDGQICNYDYIRVRPLGIVASEGGDVRVLWVEDHLMGSMVATCDIVASSVPPPPPLLPPPPPPPGCVWNPLSDSSAATMFLAWPDGEGGMQSAELLSGESIAGLNAVVDVSGQVHVAAYIQDGFDTVVRYLRWGL